MAGILAVVGRYGRTPAPEVASFAETPLAGVLTVLGARWTVLAMRALHSGHSQFNQLQRRLEGISHKVLVDTLRSLQRDGLVHGPLSREGASGYHLTQLGRELVDLIDSIEHWAQVKSAALAGARDAFDTRARGVA